MALFLPFTEVEEDETKIWLWDSGLMRWLRMSRIGRYLCLTAILLLQLVVLLLIMWLVSFLHAGLAVPCFVVLFSLWAYSERRHAAFSDYLKHLCKMAHGPPAD